MRSTDKTFSFMLDYTTRNMRRYAIETFARAGLGITLDQWGLLLLLRESGNGMSNTELADGMVKDKPTVTRMVDVLVRKALVVRAPDENDRRQLRIGLSAKGKKTVTKAEPVVERLRKELGSALTRAQHEALLDCLNRLNETIDAGRKRAGQARQ